MSNKNGGSIYTIPHDDQYDIAYVTSSFGFLRIGYEDKEVVKELIDLSDAIAIDSVEDETISILIGVKRHSTQ